MAARSNKAAEKNSSLYKTQTAHMDSKVKPSRIIPSVFSSAAPSKKNILAVVAFAAIWLFTFFHLFPLHPAPPAIPASCDAASITPFYIHELPARFNSDLVRRCELHRATVPECQHLANAGLGEALPGMGKPFFASGEFCSDLVFHARLLRHPCRATDPASAELFFIPFHASLYTAFSFHESNHTLRDALAVDLAAHLRALPAFRRRAGRDHFLAVGRTAWDMLRSTDPSATDFGANTLLSLPELANVAVLTVERIPWEGANQYGVPYPSYFHPRAAGEMAAWQEKVRSAERTHLFAFLGGGHDVTEKAAVRTAIFSQCAAAANGPTPNPCLLVKCDDGGDGGAVGCYNPGRVVEAMISAHFCLQPPGVSFTRRAVFDAVLAGCVPVFFSDHTAYTQYAWYAPKKAMEWSVFLGPEKWYGIEEELAALRDGGAAERMREAVVAMIPRVTYAHPDAGESDVGFRDAVDVALAALTARAREDGDVGTD